MSEDTLGQALRRWRGDRSQEQAAGLIRSSVDGHAAHQTLYGRWEKDEIIPSEEWDDSISQHLRLNPTGYGLLLVKSRRAQAQKRGV